MNYIELLTQEEKVNLCGIMGGRDFKELFKHNEREFQKIRKGFRAKSLYESFNRFLIISLDVLICRYSPLLRAFPALFISEEPHKSFYYPSCFHSQK